MKRILAVIFIIFIGNISVIGVIETVKFIGFISTTMNDHMSKEDIFAYVTENQEVIKNGIENFIREKPDVNGEIGDSLPIPYPDGIKEVTVSDKKIKFYCGGYGMGSSTGYTGFYYLLSGEEITTDAKSNIADLSSLGYENKKFIPKDNGWYYKETNGDNSVYVERIVGNFYYYSEEY